MTLPIPFKFIQVQHLPGDRVTGTASTGTVVTGRITGYLAHVASDEYSGLNGYFHPEDLKTAPQLNRRLLPVRRASSAGRRAEDYVTYSTYYKERRIAQRRIQQNYDRPAYNRKDANGAGRRAEDPKTGYHNGNGYYYQ